MSECCAEVLQAVAERQVNGTAISHEGRMRGFTNGHAQYDDEVPCFHPGISFALFISLSLPGGVGSV